MRRFFGLLALNRISVSIILVMALLLGLASSAYAESSQSKTTNSAWTISISGVRGPVCVGGSYMMNVLWGPNDFNSDHLVPLTGPSAILVSANRGSFDHETERPGTISGTATFIYSAEKEGSEQLLVKAFNGSSNVDASNSASFEVKKCNYRYELVAVMNDDYQLNGVSEGMEMTYRAKGLLKAPDPNQPLNVESLNNQIKLSLIVTYMNVPDCAQITEEPVKGFGFLDAKANPTTNGSAMDLKLGPPIGLQWDMANSVACDGKVSTAISSGVLSSTKDPWIEKQFPNGEGTYAVNIDILDQTVKNINQAAGHHASYKATLHMEKVDPQ